MDKLDLDAPGRRRRKRRRALVAVLLTSSLATLGAGAMSLAVFTDSQASTGAWSTGTIVLGVSPSTAFSASNILPGASGSQDVSVSNGGTGALRYALSTSATNADSKGLAAQLTLTVNAGTCASPGAVVYATGPLGSAAFGSNAQGAQAGDRTLAAAASETLCFAWSFPLSSGNAFKNAATTATFTFDAEQTSNNP
jgi:hypothetical protein